MIQKEVIFSWLEQFGTSPSFREAEGTEWLIDAAFREIPFVVVRPKNDDRVVIQRGIGANETVLKKIRKSSLLIRKEYLFSVKKHLLLRGVRYNMKFEDNDETILKGLFLEVFIYDDGLTKNQFFSELNVIVDATYLYFAILEHSYKA